MLSPSIAELATNTISSSADTPDTVPLHVSAFSPEMDEAYRLSGSRRLEAELSRNKAVVLPNGNDILLMAFLKVITEELTEATTPNENNSEVPLTEVIFAVAV